jgi:ribosomal protein S18 acetylase RimI-like enzyme
MSGGKKDRTVQNNESRVVIRAAEPDDYARARAVQWSAGWKDAPENHRYWPAHDVEWANRHYFREFVAEVDGVVAARIGLEAYCPPFAELVNLCVRPDFRRHGLGQALTNAGQREAARMGFSILFLQTEMNNLEAHRLYAAQDWVPTAYGKMLRMVKMLDYPLLTGFKRDHPLHQYRCIPDSTAERTWYMEWYAYITDDRIRLTLESGASRSESAGMAPCITGCDWSVGQGARWLILKLTRENISNIEPGHHIELEIEATNSGTRTETGVFQMVLPPGIRVASPTTNTEQTFSWNLAPGESMRQPVVVQVEPQFDAAALWYLNYTSIPVSVETYWEGHRALMCTSLPMAK